jgi:hypothetical protein
MGYVFGSIVGAAALAAVTVAVTAFDETVRTVIRERVRRSTLASA